MPRKSDRQLRNFLVDAVLAEVLRISTHFQPLLLVYLQRWKFFYRESSPPSALQLDQCSFLVRPSYRSKCVLTIV